MGLGGAQVGTDGDHPTAGRPPKRRRGGGREKVPRRSWPAAHPSAAAASEYSGVGVVGRLWCSTQSRRGAGGGVGEGVSP